MPIKALLADSHKICSMNDLTHQAGKEFERIAKNIHPGGWAIESDRPIATLLGSCVAVCLFDPKLKLGGMNHFLLPSSTGAGNSDIDVILNGDYSMEVLVNGLLGKGAKKARLIAKAFGGGTIISHIKTEIGERNSAFAQEWLRCEGIPLVASDFNGPWSRKVVFVPNSGEVFCSRIPTTQASADKVVKEEQEFERSLEDKMRASAKNIDLFFSNNPGR